MTLLEVCIALGILGMVIAGVLATLLQSRRLSSESVAQDCAITIVQGYIEQLKNLPLNQFINAPTNTSQATPNLTTSFKLLTIKDESNLIDPTGNGVHLWTTPSTVAASTLTGASPGVTPTGVVDNLQSFDMDATTVALPTTWATAWPGANTTLTPYPTTAPGSSNLRMNFWVQIVDLTPNATPLCKAYSLLIVYTWQYVDGGRMRYLSGGVRTIRSAVQTF